MLPVIALAGVVLLPFGGAGGVPDSGSFVSRTYQGPEGERHYKLFVPAGHDPRRPAPLIVYLHGCTQDPDDAARGTRLNAAAGEAGALVVYPGQPEAAHPKKCWNWYETAHQARGAGEPASIAAVTRAVAAEFRVDAARIYIGGISAGAAMAVLTAVAYPDLYAAVGTHAGLPWRPATGVAAALAAMKGPAADFDAAAEARRIAEAMGGHRRPLRLVAFHGGADAVVAPAGSRALADEFAALAGAEARGPTETRGATGGADWVKHTWCDARGRPMVEHWEVAGIGHALVGGDPAGTFTDARGPDAAREMLRFFLARP